MTNNDYYNILGIPPGSSLELIKKAYRKKAREYHPDVNQSPGAKEHFIEATEAYEFLLEHSSDTDSEIEGRRVREEWIKYRQERARQRARAYARASYAQFRNSKLYKTTRIFDGSIIFFSVAIAVLLNIYIIGGYLYRLKHPLPDDENPTLVTFILIELGGIIIFVISLIYLKAFLETGKKSGKKDRNC